MKSPSGIQSVKIPCSDRCSLCYKPDGVCHSRNLFVMLINRIQNVVAYLPHVLSIDFWQLSSIHLLFKLITKNLNGPWSIHLDLQTLICPWRCPWCNGYRRRKWTRQHEFKSWTRQISFHIALIPLGKVWIQLFSLQLWVNSRTD